MGSLQTRPDGLTMGLLPQAAHAPVRVIERGTGNGDGCAAVRLFGELDVKPLGAGTLPISEVEVGA
jgi:hypothetical protein